ncbi:stalk domain-containing protein [Gorillibacterium sp. sgz500922]|uniref:stalk domain-containing protein n=1 Tax=Gorillibacterium sp. sgz500922 TaxID=3446694 RepID=UPI003F6715E2
MKAKRLLVLLTTFSLLFGASVYAESQWGDYEGFSKVKLRLDGAEVKVGDNDTPAVLMKERTMLPLRYVAQSLHTLVKWDPATQTVDLNRPDVHMMFAQDVADDLTTIRKPFSKVAQGRAGDFYVFVDAAGVTLPVEGFKITVYSPSGEAVASKTVNEVPPNSDESFWYLWKVNVNFAQKGDYVVKFAFQYKGELTVVSEKTITSN